MRILFLLVPLALVFGMLFGPSFWLARKLRDRGDAAALRCLRVVWPLQLITAAVLCFWADWIGLRNPAAYTMAVILAVSLGGAALLGAWRRVCRAIS